MPFDRLASEFIRILNLNFKIGDILKSLIYEPRRNYESSSPKRNANEPNCSWITQHSSQFIQTCLLKINKSSLNLF